MCDVSYDGGRRDGEVFFVLFELISQEVIQSVRSVISSEDIQR